jgi:hypothetical protein
MIGHALHVSPPLIDRAGGVSQINELSGFGYLFGRWL